MAAARLLLVFALSLLLFSQETKGQGSGSVRLFKDGNRNPKNTRGYLEVFYNGKWGTVCSSDNCNNYGNIPAVVCHQLGYGGGQSEKSDNLGTVDPSPPVLTNVSCDSTNYLVILQCKFSLANAFKCQSAQQKVKVKCDPASLWDSPYTGMVRLKDGYYTGQGIVEVYCNKDWGAICYSDSFNTNTAKTICTQLGYTSATSINYTKELDNVGKIWYEHLRCPDTKSCLSSCASCPSSPATSCGDHGVVNVTCSHDGTNNDGSHQCTCKLQGGTQHSNDPTKVWFGIGGIGLGIFSTLLAVLALYCMCKRIGFIHVDLTCCCKCRCKYNKNDIGCNETQLLNDKAEGDPNDLA